MTMIQRGEPSLTNPTRLGAYGDHVVGWALEANKAPVTCYCRRVIAYRGLRRHLATEWSCRMLREVISLEELGWWPLAIGFWNSWVPTLFGPARVPYLRAPKISRERRRPYVFEWAYWADANVVHAVHVLGLLAIWDGMPEFPRECMWREQILKMLVQSETRKIILTYAKLMGDGGPASDIPRLAEVARDLEKQLDPPSPGVSWANDLLYEQKQPELGMR